MDFANKEISNKEIFDLWIQLGSIYRVQRNLAARGIINRFTRKPLHASSIFERMSRWILDNPKEAKDIYEEVLNRKISQEQWNRYLVKKARKNFDCAPRLFEAWVKKHGFEKYRDSWKDRFSDRFLDRQRD